MNKGRKKAFIITSTVVIAVVGVFCCVIALGNKSDSGQPEQVVAVSDESDVLFEFREDVAAEREATDATCHANISEGTVRSFEMRFSRREDIDALLAGGENIYFASVDYGNGSVAIPMENIKILTDITTGEYVLTIVPTGENVDLERVSNSEVRFYIAPQETPNSDILFMARAFCLK